MNIPSNEDNKKFKGGGFLLRLLLNLLPKSINPFYFLILALRYKREEKFLINREIVIKMSDVINSMSNEDKLDLTMNDFEGRTITPQQSFIDYFQKYNLLHLNVNDFKRDFIYLYYVWGKTWMKEVEEAGIKDLESINLFWERFKNYAPSISGKKHKEKKIDGLKVVLIIQSQKLRRLKRVLFSSFSWH